MNDSHAFSTIKDKQCGDFYHSQTVSYYNRQGALYKTESTMVLLYSNDKPYDKELYKTFKPRIVVFDNIDESEQPKFVVAEQPVQIQQQPKTNDAVQLPQPVPLQPTRPTPTKSVDDDQVQYGANNPRRSTRKVKTVIEQSVSKPREREKLPSSESVTKTKKKKQRRNADDADNAE